MRKLKLVGTAATRPDAVGGLYKLGDEAGADWELAQGIPHDASIQAITVDPRDTQRLYAAGRKGLWRSTDGGEAWHKLHVSDEAIAFWTVVVHPTRPETLFAGGGPVSVWRSDDRGDTWRRCGCTLAERFAIRFGHSRIMRIAFHATNPRTMYAVAEINGLLVSEDEGETWRGVPEGLLALAQQPHLKSRIETDDDSEGMFDAHSVCATPAAPDSLFYICRLGIFESRDLGKTFRDLEVGRFAPFVYTREMRFPPGNPRKMYACFSISSRSAAGALYLSDDLGDTWSRADAQVEPRSTMLGFGGHVSDPDALITVTRGGQVFWTFDGCKSWTEKQLPANAGDAFCGAIV